MFRLPISSAPRDGRFVILWGPSGYSNTPFRCQVGRYVADYRHAPWRTFSNDSFEDDGPAPTHWTPLESIRTVEDDKTARFALNLIGLGPADAP